jgi:hypothetical protein
MNKGMPLEIKKQGDAVLTEERWEQGEPVYYKDFWTDAITVPHDSGFEHGLVVGRICRVEGSLFNPLSALPLGHITPMTTTESHSTVVDKQSVYINVGTDFPFDRNYRLYVRIYFTAPPNS